MPAEGAKRTGLKRHWSFKEEIFVLYFAIRDHRTPYYARLMALLALVYLLSPFDLIPDFIPLAGYLDDLIIVPLVLHISFRVLPATVKEAGRIKAERQMVRLRIILFGLFLLAIGLLAAIFFAIRSIFTHW